LIILIIIDYKIQNNAMQVQYNSMQRSEIQYNSITLSNELKHGWQWRAA